MEASAPGGLLRAFEKLPDPRMNRTKHHSLKDILAIAICAVICGADGWTQVELFGNSKIKWFKTFLDLPKGIPSHDTFGRVFAMLKPEAFEACFLKWVSALTTASKGRLIAIRGYPIGSTAPYILGADQFLVSGGFDLHGLLGESVEELAAGS